MGSLWTFTVTPAAFACEAKIVAESTMPAAPFVVCRSTVRFDMPACLSSDLACSMSGSRWASEVSKHGSNGE